MEQGMVKKEQAFSAFIAFAILMVSTILIATAAAPDKPTLDYPKNGTTLADLDVFLIVKVNDPDKDLMNVTFFNATSGELVGFNHVNGSGKAACVWNDLTPGTDYDWYANASDGTNVTQSDTFAFTVQAATKSEKWEQSYIAPAEGLGWANIDNSTQILEMTLKPFLVVMGSWFYVIFMFGTVGLIYIKTQRVFMPSLILMLFGVTLVTLLPGEVIGPAVAAVGLGFTGIVYAVFKKRL